MLRHHIQGFSVIINGFEAMKKASQNIFRWMNAVPGLQI